MNRIVCSGYGQVLQGKGFGMELWKRGLLKVLGAWNGVCGR
jgi:hypothetical protein